MPAHPKLATMQTPLLLVLPLFAVACSYPRFVANKTVELDVPLAQAIKLNCTTHNGSITVMRGESSDTIHVQAEMQVRGHTQGEADDNLLLLSVGQEVDGDTLRIFGDYPRPTLSNSSPSFTFKMQVPEHLALDLTSHNGDLTAQGTTGALRLETHNGRIDGATSNKQTWAETHNGDIHLAMHSNEDLDGAVTSHNGDIKIQVSDDAKCWLNIATHNGRIQTPNSIHDATINRRSVRCGIGEGETEGKLKVVTHNGDVVVRSSSDNDKNDPK